MNETREREAWVRHAKCRDMQPTEFDAETLYERHQPADRAAAAQALCAGCPVIPECAADAHTPLAIGVVRAGLLMPAIHTGSKARRVRADLAALALGGAHV